MCGFAALCYCSLLQQLLIAVSYCSGAAAVHAAAASSEQL
jgi:hypothetical protein